MDNPFQRRATEFLRDDEAFLAIVSPEPLTLYLRRPGQAGRLYDRLVVIRGTPGSGKTTLARLFEFPSLTTLLRNSELPTYHALVAAVGDCGAIIDGRPAIVGCRLPLETDYRDFWEFPYPERLKIGLMAALVQARAVLAWIRYLTTSGIDESEIQVVPRPDAEATADAIGGTDGANVAARARDVEKALYQITGSLVAPSESDLPPEATGAYRPFDVIDRFQVATRSGPAESFLSFRPLVILDDAHVLQPNQFQALERWLARRELRIARWVISRLDVLPPREALAAVTERRADTVNYPGLSQHREIEVVLLQSGEQRRENRTNFRRMAKDMAGRYLQRMSVLSTRGLVSLPDLLGEAESTISHSEYRRLAENIEGMSRRIRITQSRRATFEKELDGYRLGGKQVASDLRLAMLAVMLARYERRRGQRTLFGDDDDLEPTRSVTANASVHEAARLHLLHKFGRPYFYGIDDLCDASSENIEQFLQLTSILVETAATQVIRSKPPLLTSETQDSLLRKRGAQIIERWNFPHHPSVLRLVSRIAERCVEVTMAPNGWLSPNAFGIPQEEFDSLPDTSQFLAQVLQFGTAYNALTLVPRYPCKGKDWCLMELGGAVVLKHGLTLKRGGFIESSVRELASLLEESPT